MSEQTQIRKERIRRALEELVTESVISEYDIQSNMPGLRWVLYGLPYWGTGRAYTTPEVEAFLDGATINSVTVPWKGGR